MEKEIRTVGYARVSTDDQDLRLQIDALVKFGINPNHIIQEKASGGNMDRKMLNLAIDVLRKDETLVVWKLDRLGRSLVGVIEAVARIEAKGANIVSITRGELHFRATISAVVVTCSNSRPKLKRFSLIISW